jgi:hypothetical protein
MLERGERIVSIIPANVPMVMVYAGDRPGSAFSCPIVGWALVVDLDSGQEIYPIVYSSSGVEVEHVGEGNAIGISEKPFKEDMWAKESHAYHFQRKSEEEAKTGG